MIPRDADFSDYVAALLDVLTRKGLMTSEEYEEALQRSVGAKKAIAMRHLGGKG